MRPTVGTIILVAARTRATERWTSGGGIGDGAVGLTRLVPPKETDARGRPP